MTIDLAATSAPGLPRERGPVTEYLLQGLRYDRWEASPLLEGDPLLDDDLQLALYICYELHYEGFAGVAPEFEWNPSVLGLRSQLEALFERAVVDLVGVEKIDPESLVGRLIDLTSDLDQGRLALFMQQDASRWHFEEFFIHRSAYQLKEADPHSWVIPRLRGPGKAALIEIQADEYGGGRADRIHAQLFAKAMDGWGLDPTYGAYLDAIPGITLALVNLVSFFALHRRWAPAAIGHLAAFEATSSLPNRSYADGLRRLGASPEVTDFFDEHVEADAVHEQIAIHDLAGAVGRKNPETAARVLFGARSLLLLEERWSGHLLDRWRATESSLLDRPTDGANP